ncbi:hypothetical protein OGATHE_003021 [Ogataea polymorpha]|uniref:Uncharacterized protein n=1 Tax=Ogataea polymorpha TaxID=460523 RepID=A0A9P8PDE9_9ASCO|nr:hypothetical protein OGATHE_003021 [Ogataea polymorpha]
MPADRSCLKTGAVESISRRITLSSFDDRLLTLCISTWNSSSSRNSSSSLSSSASSASSASSSSSSLFKASSKSSSSSSSSSFCSSTSNLMQFSTISCQTAWRTWSQ